MGGIIHLVSLRRLAGVELQFAEFVRHAVRLFPEWTHAWLNPAGPVESDLAALLDGSLSHTDRAKYIGKIKLPARPRALRSLHARAFGRRADAKLAVIWNRAARSSFLLDAMGSENVVHWEHGRAWHLGHEQDRRRYFQRIPLVLANSNAARRLLELGWDYRGEIRVCLNALRPSLMPAEATVKAFPGYRPIRLGVAARLLPVKGVALILHALAELRARGMDVELHIAGDGRDRVRLEALAARLGLSEAARFHGSLASMARFYEEIDCLLHVPLTEAFGLVGIEAGAHGCPVIAAAVDGLPEAVAEGISGYCLKPSLPIAEYASLGSDCDDVPEQVYDPLEDCLRPPALVDPAELVTAVESLFADPQGYETLSRSACERVMRDFRFDRHVAEAMGVIGAFAAKDRA